MSPEYLYYSIEELAAQTGIKERNIRYYIAEGLLHAPAERGRYDESHLVRLRFIRKLTEEYVRLEQIRRQLERYTDAEIESLLAEEQVATLDVSASLAVEQSKMERPSRRENLMDYLRHVQEPPAPAAPMSAPSIMPAPMPVPSHQRRGREVSQDWERWLLADGVELHARKPLSAEQRRLVESLIRLAQSKMP